MKTSNLNFAFFGTPDRAVFVLDELASAGLIPSVIITQPDKPQGRKMTITPPPAKVWALAHGIAVLQPEKIDDDFISSFAKFGTEIAIVIAYGKILPKKLLDTPLHGMLNIHGSLLPKYRGSSPIETAILNDDRETGVSIIQMDDKMDHGPLVASEQITLDAWPINADELAKKIVVAGARLLALSLPDYLEGKITPKEQAHAKATYTHKIKKEDGEIDLTDDAYKNFLKINAYQGWPKAYFFSEKEGKKIRVIITKAGYKNGALIIERVIPEGKNELPYNEFLKH